MKPDNRTSGGNGKSQTASLLDARVSVYGNYLPESRIGERSIGEVFKDIRTKPSAVQKKIRALLRKELGEPDTAKRKQLQKTRKRIKETQFPCFTQSGVCLNGRGDGDLSEYNGIIQIDVDKGITLGEQVEHIIEKLQSEPQYFCGVGHSPSGYVKVFV